MQKHIANVLKYSSGLVQLIINTIKGKLLKIVQFNLKLHNHFHNSDRKHNQQFKKNVYGK